MYIDAIHDRASDRILLAERIDGKRVLLSERPEYNLYHSNPTGSQRTIFGDCVSKQMFFDSKAFHRTIKQRSAKGDTLFETDINPVFRYLANHYTGADTPVLHIGFFDIEVDFDAARGFAPPDDPFSPVTAISLYHTGEALLFTLLLCPPTLTMAEGEAIADQFANTMLFADEADLLDAFLAIIDDVDVLSGWYSEGFDIPYLVNRIRLVLGEAATCRLCLWGQPPKPREYIKFNRPFKTYELLGRVHLDYLLLYQKHNTQQQHSYRLDFIGAIETGETKLPYEGTLDDLYKKDFRRFVAYNRQDVMLLVKIDAKRQYIDLANQIAHSNCVLLKTTMGSVALVETAIINAMHGMGLVVPDRKPQAHPMQVQGRGKAAEAARTPVVGAYVAEPQTGLNAEIGCVDIKSLYPSVIRALNMSPETIVGQVQLTETMALVASRIAAGTPRAEAWEGIFASLEVGHMQARDTVAVSVVFEDGRHWETTGAGLYDYVFDPANAVCISANGTLFRTDVEGIIPKLLATWYAEREVMQKTAKNFAAQALTETDPERINQAKAQASFWDQRQAGRKILLNSLYGALLNPSLRFADERIGQSTTLTGRSIDRHMAATINQHITGAYDYRGKAVIYCDTDSVYFSAYQVWKNDPAHAEQDWSRAAIIALYDQIAEAANATFAGFMVDQFHTSPARGSLIQAGRELVASRGLFIKKKKYALLVYDKEGTRLDIAKDGTPLPGKLKVMGLDLKRADTPKFMQDFLQKLLLDVLTGADQQGMYDAVKQFRGTFVARPGWEKGSPKKVANLSKFAGQMAAIAAATMADGTARSKVVMPGHVRASLNWNRLCDLHDDRYAMRLTDGARIIVCKLRRNTLGMDSVAYPIDEPHLPSWFQDLPFDDAAMEQTIIDAKLTNLVGVLDWDMPATREADSDGYFLFDTPPPVDQRGHNGGPAWDDGDDDDGESDGIEEDVSG